MSRMTQTEWHDARISRVSIVPAPWDEPTPEAQTPVGRMTEPPRITTTVPKPRPVATRAPDMFAANGEDLLRLRMQRLDGVVPEKDRFPKSVQAVNQKFGTNPNSLSQRVFQCLRKHGPITVSQIALIVGCSRASAGNALCDHRSQGRAVRDNDTSEWSAT